MKTKTNDEIDDLIKQYIDDTGNEVDKDDMEDYINTITMSTDDIDLSSLTMQADGTMLSHAYDIDTTWTTSAHPSYSSSLSSNITLTPTSDDHDYIFAEDRTEKRLDAIEKRLSILEPKKELLEKYEVLQGLYEQYKAAEALLHGEDADENEN